MSLKPPIKGAISISLLVLFSSLAILLAPGAGADAPTLTGVTFVPVPASIDAPLNITAEFSLGGEPINQVMVTPCYGEICDVPAQMSDDGSGATFYKNYPANYFGSDEVFIYIHFFVDFGTSGSISIPEDPESEEINVTLFRFPKALKLTSSLDKTVVFPNQTVTVEGRVKNDLEENVTDADIELTVVGSDQKNSSRTGTNGEFEISLALMDPGDHVLNLTASKGELKAAYREWTVKVEVWPLPSLSITGEIDHGGAELPPESEGRTYYNDTSLILRFFIENSGTGTAYNLSAVIWDSIGLQTSNVTVGNLSTAQRFEGELPLNTSTSGIRSFSISAEYDQLAPSELKVPVVPFQTTLTVVPRPIWTGHKVLLEMFTQMTCVPCGFMEEALERLYRSEGDGVELIVYVYEDEESIPIFGMNGINSTPVVLVDRTEERIVGTPGGEDVDHLLDLLGDAVDRASVRETPPAALTMERTGQNTTVTLSVRADFTANVDGLLQVYRVEPYSNLRNHQGVPVNNRFLGAAGGLEVSGLHPGGSLDLTVEGPYRREGLVAVLFGIDSSVIQTAYLSEAEQPPFYVRERTFLSELKVPGEVSFPLDLESFYHEDDGPSELGRFPFMLELDGLLPNWTASLSEDGPWTTEPIQSTFDEAASSMALLDTGRTRYNSTLSLHIRAVGEMDPSLEGLHEVRVEVKSPERTYQVKLVLQVEGGGSNGGVHRDPRIIDHYLVGENLSIFLYVEVVDIPDGGLVKGRVLPCNYGDGAACGVPKELILSRYRQDLWRAPVQGVDLYEFTHLSCEAWIEVDGRKVNDTMAKTYKIDDLIELPPLDDDDDDDPTLLIIVSASALFIILAIAALLFFLSKKGAEKEEIEGPPVQEASEPEEAGVPEGPMESEDEGPGALQETIPKQEGPVPGPGTLSGDVELPDVKDVGTDIAKDLPDSGAAAQSKSGNETSQATGIGPVSTVPPP